MKDLPEIVVMGDVNLDWVSNGNLSFPFTELKENGVITWLPIDELPGGSALNFARFALEHGYMPMLLGKTGDDSAGRFLEEWIARSGMISGLTRESSLSTGRSMIVRDRRDIRLLVNNRDNANHALSVTDVESHRLELESCRMLYVSGYCLMNRNAPRTEATIRAMELAHDPDSPKKRFVVFDVVPHRIYEFYTYDDFLELTRNVDLLISEVPTMRRFFKIGDKNEEVDAALVEETIAIMKERYNRFILRYGPGGCDVQILYDGTDDRLEWAETSHDKAAEKRGYGDLLAVKALRDFFRI